MQYNKYGDFVEEYRSKDFNAIDPATLHGAIGMVSEVGELADLLKKAAYHNRGITRDDVIDECGDILHYLQMVLTSVGSNLQECIDWNVAKLSHRRANGKDKAAERTAQLALKVA